MEQAREPDSLQSTAQASAATEFMHSLLRLLLQKKGSDLFITVGFPPAMKIDSRMTPVSTQPLTAQQSAEFAYAMMNERQRAEFEQSRECNFAIKPEGIGRFRVNVFMQQGFVGMVLRVITTTIPKLDDLGVPPVLKDIIMSKRGLLLVVGGTGSGKSTTLAGMIGHRNENSYGHIITIEDPVEYTHPHKTASLPSVRSVSTRAPGRMRCITRCVRRQT